MYIGTSIFLIALGAILRFAVTATVGGIDIKTAGTILIVVGVVALLVSILLLTVGSGRRRRVVEEDRTVVRDRDPRY